MKRLARGLSHRLHLEQLEDRLQLSVSLFGDVLEAANPWHRDKPTDAPAADVQQPTSAHAEFRTPATVAVNTPVSASATAVVPADNSGATLQLVVISGDTTQPAKHARVQARPVEQDSVAAGAATVQPLPAQPIDVADYTITTSSCGTPGTQAAAWSQYTGTDGFEENYAVDVTVGGVVYAAGIGTDAVNGDFPGLVTRREADTCTSALVGTPDANFLTFAGVNIDPAGGSVYVAGYDLLSGASVVLRLAHDLTAVEAGVQFPFVNGLNFLFDIASDAPNNRYVVGAAVDARGVYGIHVAKFDLDLSVPAVYSSLITFEDGPGGPPLHSVGWSLDVDLLGEIYVGGSIVYNDRDIRNLTLNVGFAGALDWYRTLAYAPPTQHPEGGIYGIKVLEGRVYTVGLIADSVVFGDNLLIARRGPDGAVQAAWAYFLEDGDLRGLGIDVGADGLPLAVGSATGPTGDTDAVAFKFSATLTTLIGEEVFGNPTPDPDKDDVARDLALLSTVAGDDFVVAGATTSNDFAPILNACAGEETYGGGGDGFLLRYRQPL